MTPHKNRSIDLSKPVLIYRNLKKGKDKKIYSIKQNGIVVAHTDKFILRSCDFIINKSYKEQCIKNKQRNVHAFIKGLLGNSDDVGLQFSHELHYYPFVETGFYMVISGEKIELEKASCVYTQDNRILIQK